MLDRLGREIHIGELVSIQNHPEIEIKVNWVVFEFIDYGIAIDVVVQNFITKDIRFIPLFDILKEF